MSSSLGRGRARCSASFGVTTVRWLDSPVFSATDTLRAYAAAAFGAVASTAAGTCASAVDRAVLQNAPAVSRSRAASSKRALGAADGQPRPPPGHGARRQLRVDRPRQAGGGSPEVEGRSADRDRQPDACDSLRAHLGGRLLDRGALVLTESDGTPLKFGSFYSQRFKPAVRDALPEHLHGLRFHDLRHSYASLLVEQGAHPKEMAELMGHSSVQITLDRCSHVMPRLTSALADRMDHAYRDAAPGDTSGHESDAVVVELR